VPPRLALGTGGCLVAARLGATPCTGVTAARPRDHPSPAVPGQWLFLRGAAFPASLRLLGQLSCLSAASCPREAEGCVRQPEGRAGQAWGCVCAGDFLCRRCLGGPAGGSDAAWTLIKWLWGRMSRWPVPYGRGSFLCLPWRSWLWEVVGEGLTFCWPCPGQGVAGAPASPVPHMGLSVVLPQTCCPLSGVPHVCLAVSWGVSRCAGSESAGVPALRAGGLGRGSVVRLWRRTAPWAQQRSSCRQAWRVRGLEPTPASPVLAADPPRAGIFTCALSSPDFFVLHERCPPLCCLLGMAGVLPRCSRPPPELLLVNGSC